MLRNLFSTRAQFRLLYIGSENEFSAASFHQKCDNMGATISICLSEYDYIFGFYSSVSWQSEGDLKQVDGRVFVFRIESSSKIVKVEQKDSIANVYHNSKNMFCDKG